MKGKSITKTLLIVFVVLFGFQYAGLFTTYLLEQKTRKEAEQYAQHFPVGQQKAVEEEYYLRQLDSISDQTIIHIPFVVNYSYADLKAKQIKPGLDLKGGVRFSVGFNQISFLEDRVNNPQDQNFQKALDITSLDLSRFDPDFTTIFLQEYQEVESVENILRQFNTKGKRDGDNLVASSISQLAKQLDNALTKALLQSKTMINERINHLGMGQPRIVVDKSKMQLQIEVPGVTDSERIRKLILKEAKLEFWNTYRATDNGILEKLHDSDAALKRKGGGFSSKAQCTVN